VALALPGSALAWTVTGAWWSWQDHPIEDPFRVVAESFPADAGDTGEVVDAIREEMDQWSGLGLDLDVPFGGVSDTLALDPEGLFLVEYASVSGSLGGTLAFAGTWAYDDGAAFDCDVVFLAANDYGALYWDADPAGPASGRYDLRAVALHELGHCIGLDHSEQSSAVMYAYYGGLRTLTADDIAGAQALYDPDPCVDDDGDGWTTCASDCDDANALVHPGAGEACNGVDDDCDGVIDSLAQRVDLFGDGGAGGTANWTAFGNAYAIAAPTRLVSWKARITATPGTRMVWAVYAGDDAAGPFSLVRTERSEATGDGWEAGPRFDLPLGAGRVYTFVTGAMESGARMRYQSEAPLDTLGPLTPLGAVVGRALADDAQTIDPSGLAAQEVTVLDLADPDGDGVTGLCGDCLPDDAATAGGLVEVCDGVDNDCDTLVDEDLDADGDGVADCFDTDGDGACDGVDPCPDDPTDDTDGDGACDGVDPCPEDPADDADGDGSCDGEDPCPDDPADACDDKVEAPPAACGCGSGVGPTTAWLALIASLALRRRIG